MSVKGLLIRAVVSVTLWQRFLMNFVPLMITFQRFYHTSLKLLTTRYTVLLCLSFFFFGWMKPIFSNFFCLFIFFSKMGAMRSQHFNFDIKTTVWMVGRRDITNLGTILSSRRSLQFWKCLCLVSSKSQPHLHLLPSAFANTPLLLCTIYQAIKVFLFRQWTPLLVCLQGNLLRPVN